MEFDKTTGPEPQSGLIDRLAEAFGGDERITACWLRGSFGSGHADEYSDIDMTIAVDDEQFPEALRSAREMAADAGDVLVAWDSPKDINGAGFTFFYADCNFLDVKVCRASRVRFLRDSGPFRVMFDRGGIAPTGDVPVNRDEDVVPPLSEQVRWKMLFLCLGIHSAVRFLKREEYWYAAGVISSIRGTLAQIFWLWKHPGELTDMSYLVWGVVRRDFGEELLAEMASTVSDAEKAEMTNTLGRIIDTFRRYAAQIARDTGAEYPEQLVDVVTDYYRRECGDGMSDA